MEPSDSRTELQLRTDSPLGTPNRDAGDGSTPTGTPRKSGKTKKYDVQSSMHHDADEQQSSSSKPSRLHFAKKKDKKKDKGYKHFHADEDDESCLVGDDDDDASKSRGATAAASAEPGSKKKQSSADAITKSKETPAAVKRKATTTTSASSGKALPKQKLQVSFSHQRVPGPAGGANQRTTADDVDEKRRHASDSAQRSAVVVTTTTTAGDKSSRKLLSTLPLHDDPFRFLSSKSKKKKATTTAASANRRASRETYPAQQNSESLQATPVKKRSRDSDVFGVSLAKAVERWPSPDGQPTPGFVRELLGAIEANSSAMDDDVLYRVAASHAKKEDLRVLINRQSAQGDCKLELKRYDALLLADLLKTWLRELPEPLLPHEQQKKLREPAEKLFALQSNSTSDPAVKKKIDSAITKIRSILATLPDANYHLLAYICMHLRRLLQRSRRHTLSASAFATLLNPVLRIREQRLLAVLLERADDVFRRFDYRVSATQLAAARSASSSTRPSSEQMPSDEAALEREIRREEALLMKLHSIIKHKPQDDREPHDDQLWEKQRHVTAMKRKMKELQRSKRALGKASAPLSVDASSSEKGAGDASKRAAAAAHQAELTPQPALYKHRFHEEETPDQLRRASLRELYYQLNLERILLDERAQLVRQCEAEESELQEILENYYHNATDDDDRDEVAEADADEEDRGKRTRLVAHLFELIETADELEALNASVCDQVIQEADIIASSKAWLLTDKLKEYDQSHAAAASTQRPSTPTVVVAETPSSSTVELEPDSTIAEVHAAPAAPSSADEPDVDGIDQADAAESCSAVDATATEPSDDVHSDDIVVHHDCVEDDGQVAAMTFDAEETDSVETADVGGAAIVTAVDAIAVDDNVRFHGDVDNELDDDHAMERAIDAPLAAYSVAPVEPALVEADRPRANDDDAESSAVEITDEAIGQPNSTVLESDNAATHSEASSDVKQH